MDRFRLMSVFVAVAEGEGFAAAGRRLGLSPPAVTRAIAELEARLGVRLLTRTTRHVRVTEAGQRYLDSARRILAEADEADELAAGAGKAPRGRLAVTAPVLFGSLYVVPGIVEFLQRYPDVTVSAVLLDRVVNLLDEGFDVGVRIGELADSTLRAVAVGRVRRVVCAAPDYLVRHGTPVRPEDLTGHVVIAASAVSPATEWQFAGARKAVRLQPRLTVSGNEAAIQAALLGFGITRLMSYQVAAHVAAGRLTPILVDDEPPPLPVHLLHAEGRQASAKVRAFIDLLAARLRGDPALA